MEEGVDVLVPVLELVPVGESVDEGDLVDGGVAPWDCVTEGVGADVEDTVPVTLALYVDAAVDDGELLNAEHDPDGHVPTTH